MSTYDRVRDLPVLVEGYRLEGRALDLGGMVRRTTTITLVGGGTEGTGEDVTYGEAEQLAFQSGSSAPDISGEHTIDALSRLLDGLDLFGAEPELPMYRAYRQWAFESAAMDLALRQAGLPLTEALGRNARPVTFVVSSRLGEPPSLERLRELRRRNPTSRFKLDATSSWTEEIFAELASWGAVDSIDLKGAYSGTPVDQPPDPVLYQRVVDAFPEAWIEDPALTPETEPILAAHRDRVTWDAPIHSVADVEALPFAPRTINVKPSRSGSWRRVLELFDYCAERGIGTYGGGQTELGVGRGHIQYLASLFGPDGPNDVAPSGYNEPELPADLPASPLTAEPAPIGFRWGTAT